MARLLSVFCLSLCEAELLAESTVSSPTKGAYHVAPPFFRRYIVVVSYIDSRIRPLPPHVNSIFVLVESRVHKVVQTFGVTFSEYLDVINEHRLKAI